MQDLRQKYLQWLTTEWPKKHPSQHQHLIQNHTCLSFQTQILMIQS
jgi:hypothetical protein